MNPHDVLGVERGATPDQIKAAYRAKAKVHHPDLNKNSPESIKAFQEIQEAYEALSQPEAQHHHHQHQHDPFGAFDFNTFENVFADMFHRAQRSQPRVNPSKTIVINVTLEQVLTGCEFDITIDDLPEKPVYRVQVPAGIQHEQRIRIPGAGPRDDEHLPPGDIYLLVAVRQHARFRRHPNNILTTDIEIDSLEAILGTEVVIQGLDGSAVRVAIPAGTQFADRVMIPGQGLGDSGARAPLYVNIGVKTPTNLTEKHIDLVQRLKEMLPNSSRLE
jgi:curved DNA-binding protein